ncbi:MAG: lysozyme [Desulfovibrio sp.]
MPAFDQHHLRINDEGLRIIKQFEDLRLRAYLCPAHVWTIGYGHTGPDVHQGAEIDEARADKLLAADLDHFERGVADMTRGLGLNGNQFSALVSFAYNVGLSALQTSTLLRKVREGDLFGAGMEFPRWNKSGGRVLPGLVKRRAAERALFEKPKAGGAQ